MGQGDHMSSQGDASLRYGPESERTLSFIVDGTPCIAYPGDTIAAALYAAGRRAWRRSRHGDLRGLLCGIGVCFDCLVTVDGIPNQRACQVEVRDGMAVETNLEARL
jgi:predicted molibdopterin-dependent oxidoreductase YjgC